MGRIVERTVGTFQDSKLRVRYGRATRSDPTILNPSLVHQVWAHTCQSVIFIEFSRQHRESPQASQRASCSRFEFFLVKSSESRFKNGYIEFMKCLWRCWWRRSCGGCLGGCNEHGIRVHLGLDSRHFHLHFHLSYSNLVLL